MLNPPRNSTPNPKNIAHSSDKKPLKKINNFASDQKPTKITLE